MNMPVCDTLIRNVLVLDGSSAEPRRGDVAMVDGKIAEIGDLARYSAASSIEGKGRILAPGFVDVHTHDDLYLLRSPQMLPKLSQGVTTVIVGNCGISAAPVTLEKAFPDPMNLLGESDAFRYPTFRDYVKAIEAAKPAVNVAALVGHTSLRNNHMDRLDREASGSEIAAMRAQLREALDHGALGLSTGLAYLSANSASSEEVMEIAQPLKEAQAIYTTHLRSETNSVLDAMQEAFRIGAHAKVPIVISHLKCAGVDNWGRSAELLTSLETARRHQPAVCDCYPYSASSSTL